VDIQGYHNLFTIITLLRKILAWKKVWDKNALGYTSVANLVEARTCTGDDSFWLPMPSKPHGLGWVETHRAWEILLIPKEEKRNQQLDCPNLITWPYKNTPCQVEIPMLFRKFSQAPVAHACNPHYSGGRDQEDHGLKLAQASSLRDPISKKLITRKDWWSGLCCRPWVQALVPPKKKKKKIQRTGNVGQWQSSCLLDEQGPGFDSKHHQSINQLIRRKFTEKGQAEDKNHAMLEDVYEMTKHGKIPSRYMF
jgi:hypothetical protein